MFLVFNKEKVCAYIVSVVTVCFLFFLASGTTKDAIETSTNTIYNNQVTENKVNMNNTVK